MDPAAAAAALSEQEIGHFDALDLSISTAAQRRFLGVVGAGRAHVAAVIEWCDGVAPAPATLRLRLTNCRPLPAASEPRVDHGMGGIETREERSM